MPADEEKEDEYGCDENPDKKESEKDDNKDESTTNTDDEKQDNQVDKTDEEEEENSKSFSVDEVKSAIMESVVTAISAVFDSLFKDDDQEKKEGEMQSQIAFSAENKNNFEKLEKEYQKKLSNLSFENLKVQKKVSEQQREDFLKVAIGNGIEFAENIFSKMENKLPPEGEQPLKSDNSAIENDLTRQKAEYAKKYGIDESYIPTKGGKK